MAFKVMKVFDWSKMPSQLGYDFCEIAEAGNDSYAHWFVGKRAEDAERYKYDEDKIETYKAIDSWLIDQGAENNERVLVSVCW